MFDLDLWREIFQSINKNRTRAILSGFTVVFAIMLFGILFGMINGLNNTFTEAFADDANNVIFINSGTTSKAHKGLQAGRRIQFENKDLQYVKDKNENKVEYITARLYKNVTASYKNEQNNYNVRACHPDHQYLENTLMRDGRFINHSDIENKTKTVVIGRLVEKDLFLKAKALGKYLNLNGIMYKVIGVFEDVGGDNEERIIYMPVTTAQMVYGNKEYIDQINLTYNPKMNFNEALAFSNTLEKDLKERFSVSKTDQRAIRVRNMAEAKKNVNQMLFVLRILAIVIGMGTLIAGIVGISNIMIFIVKERTKEIGIRKALGASPKSIVSIIILEATLITSIAGYVGLFIGLFILRRFGPVLEEYFIKDPSVSPPPLF